MLRYAWPGDVRELDHAMERAVLLSRTLHLQVDGPPPLGRSNRRLSFERCTVFWLIAPAFPVCILTAILTNVTTRSD